MYAKWILSIEMPLFGTGEWNYSLPGPEGRNIHKFDYISEPIYSECSLVVQTTEKLTGSLPDLATYNVYKVNASNRGLS